MIAADLRPQPVGDQPQQAVSHRMAEGIVDVLEQVEVDAQYGDTLVAGFRLDECLAQPFPVELAVRKIGQPVVVGHIGHARLRLAALGDIDDGDEIAVAAVEHHPASEGQHVNLAAVGLDVPPVAGGLVGIADVQQRFLVGDPLVFRPDFIELHAQEFLAGVAVMLDGRIVDAEEFCCFGVEHPHRHGVVVEQQAERSFAPFQGGNVGNGQRENVGEGDDTQLQAPVVAVEFKLVSLTAPDHRQQPLDDMAGGEKISSAAKSLPQQFGRRQFEQPRRAIVVVHDLEVERTALGIADRGKRQHAFVGGGEDRIEQIVLGLTLVDINTNQRVTPARRGRKGQYVVGPDQAIAHAMGDRKIRAAFGERTAGGLGQGSCAVRRQRIERDIPSVVLQPQLGVAAGTRHFETLRSVLEQNDVIGEPAKAAQHHVFISRQFLAGPHRGLPLALKNRDIVEHLGRGFIRRLPGSKHGIPQQRAKQRASSMRAALKGV